MLDVSDSALARHAADDRAAYRTGEHGIFGIVLEVPSAERASVHVAAGSVPAGRVGEHGFVADHYALFLGEFCVPCGRDKHRAYPERTHAVCRFGYHSGFFLRFRSIIIVSLLIAVPGYLARSVDIHLEGQIDRLDRRSAVRALRRELTKLRPSELVHKLFPLFRAVVRALHDRAVFHLVERVIDARHIADVYRNIGIIRRMAFRLRPCRRHARNIELRILRVVCKRGIGLVAFHHIYPCPVDGPIRFARRLGLLQTAFARDKIVYKRIVGRVVFGVLAVRLTEYGVYFFARIEVGFAINAFFDGALDRQNGRMRVARRRYNIIARFEFVPAEPVVVFVLPIERRHILRREFKRDGLAVSGFEQTGFAVSHEHALGFFYAALGIRLSRI